MGGLAFSPPCPTYHPTEFQGQLLWVPRRSKASDGPEPLEDEEATLECGVPCVLLEHEGASRLVIYFHANAEDLGQTYFMVRQLRQRLSMHVLAVEYAGYGVCSGEASGAQILEDAESVLVFACTRLRVPLFRVVLMGRSLGGGPAIDLASKFGKCAALVTLSTFSSVRRVVASHVGLSFGFPDVFNNVDRIRFVRCRTLIIHGSVDGVVDVGQARELYEACGSATEKQVAVRLNIRQDLDHNDYNVDMDIARPMWEAFPELWMTSSDPLKLKADAWLKLRVECLAPDVAERVPYVPQVVPYGVEGSMTKRADALDALRFFGSTKSSWIASHTTAASPGYCLGSDGSPSPRATPGQRVAPAKSSRKPPAPPFTDIRQRRSHGAAIGRIPKGT
eukprot:TRINITY_DN49321_c0_g1_i1.p1 TRINITY_DN49321_c0_g1~~TRINITY_DN49321_c0_g1_i1.p1  ORF type:complete len:392 (+),score=53.50 TRINITY_DN49321_c0_g1_i1:122-1297(+)